MEKTNIYANGQIYAIRSHQTELIYIGSTCQPLHKRFHSHKRSLKNYITTILYCSSYEILKYEDAYIELIEDFPCNSKKELNRREGLHIRNSENCVNKRIAGRTVKEYYDEHKQEYVQRGKEYRENNKEKILERSKEYYECNKDEIFKRQKIYRTANKDEINRKAREAYAAKKSKDQIAS